jgi:hypothetical protein
MRPVSSEHDGTFEAALSEAEQNAAAVLKSAAKVVAALKTMEKAAREGDMRKLRAAPETIRQCMDALDQQVTRVEAAWSFDEEAYLRDGGYASELLALASAQRLQVVQQDDRFFSYPVLVSMAPADRAVKIDRKVERKIRPSVLVAALRSLQLQPSRAKSGPFLESLWSAYQIAVDRQSKKRRDNSVVPLTELYSLFTLGAGQSRDYPLQAFVRDVYLLDQNGTTTTKDGATVDFHASTGTKSGRALSIVTQTGAERQYFGISFRRERD